MTLRFDPGEPLDEEHLAAWTIESSRACAPKTILKQLDQAEVAP